MTWLYFDEPSEVKGQPEDQLSVNSEPLEVTLVVFLNCQKYFFFSPAISKSTENFETWV